MGVDASVVTLILDHAGDVLSIYLRSRPAAALFCLSIKLQESAGLNGMIWHDAGRSGGHELTAGGQKKNHCGGGRDWSEIQRERDKESMPAQGSTIDLPHFIVFKLHSVNTRVCVYTRTCAVCVGGRE